MSRSSGAVPSFVLFGEQRPTDPSLLHLEDIQSRSRGYRWEIGAHTHPGLAQVLFVTRGPARVSLDGGAAEVAGPATVLIPPATVHAFRFSARTRGWVLTFAPLPVLDSETAALRTALQSLLAAPRIDRLHWRGDLCLRLEALFERLMAEIRQPDSTASPVPVWLSRSLLWILAKELPGPEAMQAETRRHHQLYLRLRALIEAHYAEHRPVQWYASRLNLTVGRLDRLCRAQSDTSAFDLIQARLALEARRRLIYVAAPIAQIAYELGFEDPAYFSRFFRRHAGMTPSAFRRSRQVEAGVGGPQ